MSYQNFVYLSEELSRKKAINVQWGECEVLFSLDTKNDVWKVQSSISQDPQVAEEMHVLANIGLQKNPCIRYDEKGKKELLYIKEFQKTNRYTLFRRFMKNYLEEAKSWKLTLDLESDEE